jgi:hypothetical protein
MTLLSNKFNSWYFLDNNNKKSIERINKELNVRINLKSQLNVECFVE